MSMQERIMTMARYLDDELMQDAKSSSEFDIDVIEYNMTALQSMVTEGRADSVAFLLKYGANPNLIIDDWSCVFQAIQSNRPEILKQLLDAGADPNQQADYRVAVVEACAQPSSTMLKLLIEAGADVNKDSDGSTALARSISDGHIDCIEILIEAGAKLDGEREQHPVLAAYDACRDDVLSLILQAGGNPDVIYNDGYTLLHYAISSCRISTVAILLEHGAAIEVSASDGLLPLHRAAMWGNAKILEMLLARQVDILSEDAHGWTALMYADFHYVDAAITCLKQAGATYSGTPYWHAINEINRGYGDDFESIFALLSDADSFILNKALEAAVRSARHVDLIKGLIDLGAQADQPTQKNERLIEIAIDLKHEEIMEALLESGVTLFFPGIQLLSTPLNRVIETGLPHLVALVLRYMNKEEHGEGLNQAARTASLANNIEILDMLIEAGAEITAEPSFPHLSGHLSNIVQEHQHEMLAHLLENGADVEEPGWNGMTPLHVAAENGDQKSVEILLQNGANVNAHANENIAPLHFAVKGGFTEIASMLLAAGASVDEDLNRMLFMHPPLVIAAIQTGDEALVKLLLKHKVALDVADSMKSSPLHVAVSYDFAHLLPMLIDAGADVRAINMMRQTPLELARDNENEEAVRILEDTLAQ